MDNGNIDDFLWNFGMSEEYQSRSQDNWQEIIRPSTVSVILGNKGTGKSALAYYLAETLGAHYNLLPVVVNLPFSKRSLLPDSFAIRNLDEVKTLENSIATIDEGTTMIPAGQKKLEELVKGFVALSRQRNQIILFVFHASSDVGSRILRGVDVVLLKEPSRRQIQFGAKDNWFRELLVEAKDKFKALEQMGADKRKYTFVDSEDPDFRGILQNDLSSFWGEELSKAWAAVDLEDVTQKQAKSPVATESGEETTKEYYDTKIGHLFPEGITDEILDILMDYDGAYNLEQLKEMCRASGVSLGGDKKILAAKLLAYQRRQK